MTLSDNRDHTVNGYSVITIAAMMVATLIGVKRAAQPLSQRHASRESREVLES